MDIFSPIQRFADLVTATMLHLEPSSYLYKSLNFFIYDVIKIGILLLLINIVMAIIRYYFPVEKVKNILSSRRWYGFEYLLAAMLGAITPFCSCSSIPLFMGFLSAGIPLGVTFTFLISSPLVNESSLLLFPALLGPKISLLYNIIGMLISILGGLLIQKLHLEKFVDTSFFTLSKIENLETKERKESFLNLIKMWLLEGWEISKKIFPYVLLGVGLGAIIHGFVPSSFVEQALSKKTWWSVLAATAIGIPLYANSVSIIPIVEALVQKGVPLGTALAFMTSTVTLSIPEALMLKKVLKLPLLVIFFSITTVGILCIGFIFNIL